ncbi:TolC family protein [Desulfosediminicola sp.]|uniref:TolC family protein n=1 Tax=Desulfosediminicola sp. TaxID=2886825 RepID=UPI003AF2DCF5
MHTIGEHNDFSSQVLFIERPGRVERVEEKTNPMSCCYGLTGSMLLMVALFLQPIPALCSVDHELLDFVHVALIQSDTSLDVRDSLQISEIDVNLAEHQFDTRIVPLTSIGFTEGTGSQQLGVEFRKEVETGTNITYGVVGNRVDEDTDYVVENRNSASAFVRVSQGLFRRWGRKYNLTNLDVARLRNELASIDGDRQMQSLVLTTSQKYYSLLLEDQLLRQSRQALVRSKEHLDSAVSRQSVGLVSKVDVYRAELAALNAESMLQSQERRRQQAYDDFREQLHLPEETELEWQARIDKIMPVLPADWERTVLDNRLDWQEYLMNVQISKREMYKVERDLLPDVGLSFTVEQRGEGDSAEEALQLDDTNWSFQVQMNSPINDRAEKSALLRKQLEMSRLRREGETLRRKIRREIKDGFAELQMAEQRHQVSRRQLEQARLAIDLAKSRYAKGLSDNLDMLDAESALSDAELGTSRSLVEYNNAAIQLAYVMGILNTEWLRISVR